MATICCGFVSGCWPSFQSQNLTRQTDGMISDIWLFDVEPSNAIRFTVGLDLAYNPIWSPDGGRIVADPTRAL
jgi:hypothetical protein